MRELSMDELNQATGGVTDLQRAYEFFRDNGYLAEIRSVLMTKGKSACVERQKEILREHGLEKYSRYANSIAGLV